MSGRPRMTVGPSVLLFSPLPPPEGGIATWTTRVLSAHAFARLSLRHLDSSLRSGHSQLGRGSIVRRLAMAARLFPVFAWVCLRTKPDVVHLTSSGFPGFYRDVVYIAIARALGRRVILNPRLGAPGRFTRRAPRPLRPLIRLAVRACTLVAPLSEEIASELRGLGASDVQVVPNCIDVREHPLREKPRPDVLRVLYLGWVIPAKGVPELLKAAARSTAWSLAIAGPLIESAWSGEPPEETVKAKGLSGRVWFLGHKSPDEARSLFEHYDVLALPSHTEGFPNVVLEAMEAGIPAVATRVGAIPEMLRDGIDGFVIPVGDVDSLVDRIERLAADPELRLRMGSSARDRVIERYSIDRVAAMWVDLYRRVAGR